MTGSAKTAKGRSVPGISLERFAATMRADFRFAPLNVLMLVVFYAVGLGVHLPANGFSDDAVDQCL